MSREEYLELLASVQVLKDLIMRLPLTGQGPMFEEIRRKEAKRALLTIEKMHNILIASESVFIRGK